MKALKRRVSDGMALLERDGPEGWRDKIDCASLDLGRCDRCILGQLFGDYAHGLMTMKPTGRDDDESDRLFAVAHGFERTVTHPVLLTSVKRQYAALTEAWREALDCDDVP